MVLLETATESAGVNAVIAENLLENLSSKAMLLYESMREVARKVSNARGYVETVSQVHFFAPGEIVADALCMARSTLYLKLEELRAADLIEARAHYVTHKSRTRADGMVWAVKMHPERPGAVRVPHDALKKSYRCLSADVEDGRTAWREIGQSKKTPTKQVDIRKILSWSIPPVTTQRPDRGLTVRCDLEQVLDVPYVDKGDRREAVDRAAQTLSAVLGDRGGLMFYRWLLWQLLRLSERTGGDYWHTVYEQAQRASVDAQEGFARRPGALFVSRLKTAPWWDEVVRSPSVRVAGRFEA